MSLIIGTRRLLFSFSFSFDLRFPPFFCYPFHPRSLSIFSINCGGARTSPWRVFVLHVCILQKPCRRYHPCWLFVAADYSSPVGVESCIPRMITPWCTSKVLVQTGSMHTRPLFLCLWCNKPHSFPFPFPSVQPCYNFGRLFDHFHNSALGSVFSSFFFFLFLLFWFLVLRYVPTSYEEGNLFSALISAFCQKMVGCVNFSMLFSRACLLFGIGCLITFR